MPSPIHRMTPAERERYAAGRASFERGDIDNALQSLGPLLEARSGFADLHYMVGVMLDHQGDIQITRFCLGKSSPLTDLLLPIWNRGEK